MTRYENTFKQNGSESFKLTFAEIEQSGDIPIDHSFLNYKKELVDYCYKVAKISMKEQTVSFERIGELVMATTKEYHDYIVECLFKVGDITTKKMMGEYCIYYKGKLIGDLCDNRLLVKQTDTSNRLLKNCKLEYPYEGSKTLMYVVEEIEDTDLMRELLEGLNTELPEPKKRKK